MGVVNNTPLMQSYVTLAKKSPQLAHWQFICIVPNYKASEIPKLCMSINPYYVNLSTIDDIK